MMALVNSVRPYAWGSRMQLARLQRRPMPAPGPEAELWMGAHPSAPSLVRMPVASHAHTPGSGPGNVPLTTAISADPDGLLGRDVISRYGPRLPYLMKILAAAGPLSLQVHPDAEQARLGFAAEERASAPVGSPGRNYVDPYHKPELLVALTRFDALCGFRDPDRSADVLASLELDTLAPLVATLRLGATGLRSAVELLLNWPEADRSRLVAAVRARALATGPELAVWLAGAYPDDVGVLVALLLNPVRLEPGEAIFMPAGNLHTYLRGTGVEVMAASDNVLRCGLTPKHVDIAETIRLLRYEVLADPVRPPVQLCPGVVTWPVPVPDFALVRASIPAGHGTRPVRLPGTGPRIVICVQGSARLGAGESVLDLEQGEAAFLGAGEPELEVAGDDTVVFQAAPGR